MNQTFLNTKEDMDWLFDVHLKHLNNVREWFKSAVLFGNEDCPKVIRLYEATDPNYDDWYKELELEQED